MEIKGLVPLVCMWFGEVFDRNLCKDPRPMDIFGIGVDTQYVLLIEMGERYARRYRSLVSLDAVVSVSEQPIAFKETGQTARLVRLPVRVYKTSRKSCRGRTRV